MDHSETTGSGLVDTDDHGDGAARRETAPGDRLTAQLAGDTVEAKIDALHAKHFAGTALAAETALWNMVHAYTQDIKRLLAELEDEVEKL